jgi:hypothetical protein
MSEIKNCSLEIYSLNSTDKIQLYRKILDLIDCKSPYYVYELLNSESGNSNDLYFFIFSSGQDDIFAVMPFLLRKIIIDKDDTGLFDVCSPWGYNGPYFKASISKELEIEFWKQVDNWYEANNVVSEFLRFNFFSNYENYSGDVVHTLNNVHGDITDWDTFWSNLKSNTRNQYRKAEKLGLTFEIHHGSISKDVIMSFYEIYIGTMDRRDAIESFYHPLDYFINICFENPGKCAIGLVYEGDKPISSEFFLISEDTIFSFLGGTDSDYYKLRPNEFLKINAMNWARKHELIYYMIGGGLSNKEDDNLYLYKKKYFQHDEDIKFFTGRKIVQSKKYLELLIKSGKKDNVNMTLPDIRQGFFPGYR